MWIPFVLVAITCAASAFMIVFVVALLRESSPSASCWVIPLASSVRAVNLHTTIEDELVLEDGSLESLPLKAEFKEWWDKEVRDNHGRYDDFRNTARNRSRPQNIVSRWRIERNF